MPLDAPAADAPPAGFWRRAVAMGLDFVVFAVVQFSFGKIARYLFGPEIANSWVLQLDLVVFTIVFSVAYTTALHAVDGQTIGKMVVGVRVVGLDGEPPAPGLAFMRYLAYFVSLAPFGLGYLMAGLRRDKRALHDLLAGTRVERARWESPAFPASASSEPGDQVAPPVA
jgi:uncharacterized RDD family membrane protein YckC